MLFTKILLSTCFCVGTLLSMAGTEISTPLACGPSTITVITAPANIGNLETTRAVFPSGCYPDMVVMSVYTTGGDGSPVLVGFQIYYIGGVSTYDCNWTPSVGGEHWTVVEWYEVDYTIHQYSLLGSATGGFIIVT